MLVKVHGNIELVFIAKVERDNKEGEGETEESEKFTELQRSSEEEKIQLVCYSQS